MGVPLEGKNKEEKADLFKWMNHFLNTSWPKEATFT